MANESKETSPDNTQSTQQERSKLSPVGFSAHISEFATTALAYLGGFQDPETKGAIFDLEMAKRMIDTIEMLKEKTQGNLTAPEGNFLESTLHNLRMTYIRAVNNPPAKKPASSESASGTSSEGTKTGG
jgi:hypothetical protein